MKFLFLLLSIAVVAAPIDNIVPALSFPTHYKVSYLQTNVSNGGVTALLIKTNVYVMDFQESLEDHDRSQLFKDQSNVLYARDSKSAIYNKDKKWYELAFKDEPKRDQFKPRPIKQLIPVSGCLYGAPGQNQQTLDLGYTVGIGASGGVSSTLGVVIGFLTLNSGASTSVGAGYIYAGGFSCGVRDGYFVQLFLQPYAADVPEATIMEVEPPSWKHKFLRKLNGKKKSLSPIKMLAAIQPNHVCVYKKTQEELACGIRKNDWSFQL